MLEVKVEGIKFGVADTFLFSKAKPDRNGIHGNTGLFLYSFLTIKELLNFFKTKPNILENKSVICYKELSDKYHYIVVKQMDISKDSLEKYLSLM